MLPLRRIRAFTLIELLTVMGIIAVLAGLILSISGFVNKKAALSRAQAELAAMAVALDSYKADNGAYPSQPIAIAGAIPAVTGTGVNVPSATLDPRTNGNSSSGAPANSPYCLASLELYQALTGDLSNSGTGSATGTHNYLSGVKPEMYGRFNPSASISSTNQVTFLSDPFGNSYGYSTANANALQVSATTSTAATVTGTNPGYNPTYDLWCTGGQTGSPYSGATAGKPGDPQLQWLKNW